MHNDSDCSDGCGNIPHPAPINNDLELKSNNVKPDGQSEILIIPLPAMKHQPISGNHKLTGHGQDRILEVDGECDEAGNIQIGLKMRHV
jgi:hypothetical protein